MKEFLKDYFHYTRSERNGFLILALLGIGILFLPSLYNNFFSESRKTDFSAYETEIEEFMALEKEQEKNIDHTLGLFNFNPNTASVEELQQLGLSEKVSKIIENYRNKGGHFYKKEDLKKIYGLKTNEYERLEKYVVLENKTDNAKQSKAKESIDKEPMAESFEFDPNTVSREDLLRLGLSEKVSTILMNFRENGGTFRKREDLSKIYGLSDKDFERLFKYIRISEEKSDSIELTTQAAVIPPSTNPPPPQSIAINSAAPEDWQKLHGIGPYYAKKICDFRDKLGGFHSINQVSETRNLPDSVFLKIQPYLLLEGPIRKINLNRADDKELANHPYLKRTEALAIINYRKQHGPFSDLEQLHKIYALKKETIHKIRPYLSIN